MSAPDDPRPPGPRGWKCDYSLDRAAVHIRPRNDLIWHELTDDCVCGPQQEYLDLDPDVPTRWLVLHRPLDGRAMQQGGYTPSPDPTDGDGPDADGVACS